MSIQNQYGSTYIDFWSEINMVRRLNSWENEGHILKKALFLAVYKQQSSKGALYLQ